MPTALPRSPCIPHPFIHSFIHSFISCAFYSRIHCCVRFNSGEAKRFSQHENAQAKSLCHYDILSFIAKSFEFLFRISLPNSQKTSLRFSKFRRPARRTHVILMLKVSHELSENVISIFQVSQTHIHTHTLTYTHILTYPNPGWPQMAQMASDRPRWLQTALEGPR